MPADFRLHHYPIIRIHLSLGGAIGLILLKTIILPSPIKKKGEESDPIAFWLTITLGPLLPLVMGAIAHTWLMQ